MALVDKLGSALNGSGGGIILTSVDGLQDAAGKIVPVVRDFSGVAGLVRSDKGHVSTGGMVTKLQAAHDAIPLP